MSSPPRPNTFLIGAPKCGTTALAQYLADHPEVFFSTPKEPFYFSTDYPGLARLNGVSTEEAYLRLFARALPRQRVIAEGSTNYLASEVAVGKILEFDPRARFIAMLRNPIDVVHAFHAELVFGYMEDVADFAEAWRLQSVRAAGERIPPACHAPQFLQYREVARFAPQIERFQAAVPESQRRIVLFDDFAADPGRVYRQILEFLELRDDGRTQFPRVNEARERRLGSVFAWLNDPPSALARPVLALRQRLRRTRSGWIDWVRERFKSYRPRPALASDLREQLRQEFSDEVLELGARIGRDLSAWVAPPESRGARGASG
jgi:Sulfotransferase domain